MGTCIFCRIVRGEIPVKIIYQDETIIVFPSNQPLAPTHLLFVPKKHIETFLDMEEILAGKIATAVQAKARDLKLNEKSYKVVINGGKAQEVPHLHWHLLGEVV